MSWIVSTSRYRWSEGNLTDDPCLPLRWYNIRSNLVRIFAKFSRNLFFLLACKILLGVRTWPDLDLLVLFCDFLDNLWCAGFGHIMPHVHFSQNEHSLGGDDQFYHPIRRGATKAEIVKKLNKQSSRPNSHSLGNVNQKWFISLNSTDRIPVKVTGCVRDSP